MIIKLVKENNLRNYVYNYVINNMDSNKISWDKQRVICDCGKNISRGWLKDHKETHNKELFAICGGKYGSYRVRGVIDGKRIDKEITYGRRRNKEQAYKEIEIYRKELINRL